MTVNVLTMSLWEMDDAELLQWPKAMTQKMALFESHYLKTHQSRKLTWKPTEGTAEIRIAVGSKKYTIICSTLQLVLLYKIQECPGVSVARLRELTKGGRARVDTELHNMDKLLLRQGDKENETVSINFKFSSPTLRVAVNRNRGG